MYGWRPQFTSPDFTPAGRESIHTARVVPVYPSTAGLTQKRLRELLARILDRALPARRRSAGGRRARAHSAPLADALATVHFPEGGRCRAGASRPPRLRRAPCPPAHAGAARVAARIAPTSPAVASMQPMTRRPARRAAVRAHRRPGAAVDEVLGDLAAATSDAPPAPGRRGERQDGSRRRRAGGCGPGRLAGARSWRPPRSSPASITPAWRRCSMRWACGPSSSPARSAVARRARSTRRSPAGMADVVIGTHAVISAGVSLPRLGLAVVDEQHRFGVAQRAALQANAGDLEPHVLALTATPIPRTMALTFYGDLAISTIRELPPGRQPIRTEIRDRRRAAEDRGLPRHEAAADARRSSSCPLIVESTALEAASAEAEAERLRAAAAGAARRHRPRPAARR